MPLTDLPVSVLFLLFLLIFMLVGLYPAWKKSGAKFRQILRNLKSSQKFDAGLFKTVQAEKPSARQTPGGQLNSYEILLLTRLAQSQRKGLSRRQLGAELHLGAANIKQALLTLNRRGLVSVAVTHLLGIRFFLSEKGRKYALEQGIIAKLHAR